ncbi:sugar ABC transporter ATP-binding protein [Shinella pollutisoli]|uniref:Sugar ABC transporter ATP-binding protein n=1 Tax=Shinella pollutisoli TaxID=2250594 RepID=A0ABV7DF83_9HYPH|nr:sugar ABC transporter ATP-binding protein [Shinella pollutisoli]
MNAIVGVSAEKPVTSAADVFLEMNGIEKSFPGVKALQGVSFSVGRGEVHGLVGENGAGKSTLMKILSGAYHADAGTLVLSGETITAPTPASMIDRGVAVIYQEFAQAEHLSVAENIFMNRLPRNRFGRIDWKTASREAMHAMDRLGFCIDPRRLVGSLSVAQRQMVEIARAISRNARLIVLDEPSAVLGDTELEKLFRTIRTLQAEGVAFIYISHRLKEVFELCQKATVLRDGKLVSTRPIAEWTTDSLIQCMVGRPIADYFPQRNARPGEEVLGVSGLSRGKALKNVSLSLRKGEIVGICGLAGAGRSELLRAIVGRDPIEGGEIRLHGKVRRIASPRKAISLGIGFAPEDRKTEGLFLSQSVRFNVTISRLGNFGSTARLNLGKERVSVRDYVRRLRVKTPEIDTAIGTLSGGNQQKCVIAKQLNARCDVLLIDEPTRGVDVGARREIYELLVDLVEREGLAVLMVSSELPEIIGMCDRILVMREGEIAAELPRGASEEEIMKHATFN